MTVGTMIMSRRIRVDTRIAVLVLAAIVIASMTLAAIAQQPYPSRPIHLVVPYPSGALTDLLGRTIADRVGAALKQPVVIDNKPGAGTLVGAEFVAKQPADGYTLLMATSTTLGISPALYRPSPINPVRDFAPVSPVGTVNFFLIANPKFPAKNVKEMIDAIKAAPGKYNYASVGSGSPHHLFMEALKAEYGLDIQHVPYKGTPAALTDLLTGNIHRRFARASRCSSRERSSHSEHLPRSRRRWSPTFHRLRRRCPDTIGRHGRASSRRPGRRRTS